jgi:hypothetical protein
MRDRDAAPRVQQCRTQQLVHTQCVGRSDGRPRGCRRVGTQQLDNPRVIAAPLRNDCISMQHRRSQHGCSGIVLCQRSHACTQLPQHRAIRIAAH